VRGKPLWRASRELILRAGHLAVRQQAPVDHRDEMIERRTFKAAAMRAGRCQNIEPSHDIRPQAYVVGAKNFRLMSVALPG
jgi:hypothetical protein